MAESLETQLDVDISAALSAFQQLDQALAEVVVNFSAGLTAAVAELSQASLSVDTSQLTTDVSEALAAISTPVAIAADASALEAGIAQAVEPQTIPIEGDTEALDAEIAAAVEPQILLVDADISAAVTEVDALGDATQTVPIDADVGAAQEAIDSLEAETVVVAVEADTSGAVDAISDVGGAASGATGQVLDLSGATSGFAAASALGRGEAAGLASGVGVLGGAAAAVGAGFAAGAATVGVFFHQALEAQAAVQRLDGAMGPLADRIENLKVGNLNADLAELALALGSDDDSLRNVAATLFLFQTGAGTSRIEASKFSETVLALSSRAVALNPALGNVEDIAGRLGNTLGRGGRFASAFQLSLSQTEIKARAAENATQGLGDGVSFASLQLAGGQIALEKYGDHLDEDIAKGTENPIIKLAALRQKFEEATEAIGAPLVAPIFEILTAIEPVAESVAATIGGLGSVAIPVVDSLITALVPVAPLLDGFADGLGIVADGLSAVPPPALAATVALTTLAVVGRAAATAFVQAGIVFASTPFGQAALVLGATITALGLVSDSEKATVVDTAALSGAFSNASVSGDAFVGTLTGLDRAINDYLKAQLQVGDVGDRAIDATNRLGISQDQLADALTGTDPQFRRFEDNLFTLENSSTAGKEAMKALFETVEQGRDTLQASAAGALAAAVSNDVLTQSEVDRLAAQNKVQISTADGLITTGTDWIAILELEASTIDKATAKQLALTRENAIASAGFVTFAAGIKDASIGAASLAAEAEKLGIAEADANAIFQTQTAAIRDQADEQILASAAAQQLTDAVATGALSAADAQIAFLQLGVSLPATTQAISDTTSAVDAFVTTALGNLPTAANAAQQWQQDVSAAFERASDDVTNQTGNIEADLAALAANSDPKRFAENLNAQTLSVLTFQTSLESLITAGLGRLAGFLTTLPIDVAGPLAAQLASDPAKAKVAQAALGLGQSALGGLDVFLRDHASELGITGQSLGVAVVDGIARTINEDGTIGAAVDQASANAATHWQPDLVTPTQAALGSVAQTIDANPQVADATRRLAEGGAAAFNPDLATPAQRALATARGAVAADGSLATATGKKGTEAAGKFGEKADIAGVSVAQFNAAVDAISKLTSVGVTAALLGADAGAKFGQGMAAGITSTTSAVEIAGAALASAGAAAARGPQGFDSGSPSKVGIEIGGEFVEGVVVGLGATTNLAVSGARLATTISTSTAGALSAVGPRIVSNIVAGFNDPATIAAGIARLRELVAQATAQSSSSISSFVSSASGALPTVGSDISEFSQGLTSALGELTTAKTAYTKASNDLVLSQSQIPHLLDRETNARERLNIAVRKGFADAAAGAPQSVLDRDVAAVQAAQANLAQIEGLLKTARGQVADDAAAVNVAATGLRGARAALAEASDPATFIVNLNKQTRAAQAFQADISRLARAGFTDLAEELAQTGPETAGKLADALANSPVRARQAEAAIDAADAFSKSYQQFLEDQFAPAVNATMGQIGATAGAALSSGISINGVPTSFSTSQNVTVTAAGSAPTVPVRQVIELDLDISLPDGTTLNAQKTIEAPTGQAVTRLRAAVKAKVNA